MPYFTDVYKKNVKTTIYQMWVTLHLYFGVKKLNLLVCINILNFIFYTCLYKSSNQQYDLNKIIQAMFYVLKIFSK